MATELTAGRLLGFKDFFLNENPRPKGYYANLVGRSLIENFCCFFLGHFRHNAIPEARDLIERAFIHYDQPFRQSPSYHVLIREFDRIANFHGEETLQLISIESLLNLFLWTQKQEDLPIEPAVDNLSTMFRALELIFLFNDDVLTNYQKAVNSAKEGDNPADYSKLLLATSFPQFDLINADYQQLVYTQLYKAVRLLNFISSTEKYKKYFLVLMRDFEQDNAKQFLMALTGVVLPPLNHDPGWSEFSPGDGKDKENSIAFLEKLSFVKEEVDIEQSDYLLLRNKPLTQMINGNYRVVYDLFLVKKLYNGLIFKLSSYWRDFFGNIRKEFSEEVLVFEVLRKIFCRSDDVVLDGDQISKIHKIEREPDFYVHRKNVIALFESKDFYIPAEIKLSYDFGELVGELQKDGRLGKALKQLARNVERVINTEFPFDNGYDIDQLIILPVIVVHDALYSTLSLNFWVQKWFETEIAPLKAKYPEFDFSKIGKVTILEIDSLILYETHFANDHIDLFEQILNFHNYVQYDKEPKGEHAKIFGVSFAEMLRSYCNFNKLYPDIPAIPEMIEKMG